MLKNLSFHCFALTEHDRLWGKTPIAVEFLVQIASVTLKITTD